MGDCHRKPVFRLSWRVLTRGPAASAGHTRTIRENSVLESYLIPSKLDVIKPSKVQRGLSVGIGRDFKVLEKENISVR